MGELGLEWEDTPARSRTILGQSLLARRQEEEMTIEQAEALLLAIRGRKDMEDDDMSGNREEEIRRITRRKRLASGELISAKTALVTYTGTSTESSVDSDAAPVGTENIDPHLVKYFRTDVVGENEAARPVKTKTPRPEALLMANRRPEDGDRGGDQKVQVKVITIEEEFVEEIFKNQRYSHATELEHSVEIEDIAVEEDSVEETFRVRPYELQLVVHDP